MLHLVDTVEVEPDRVEEYLEAVGSLGVRVMTDAGACLVSCATTLAGTGEAVGVQVVWGFADLEAWNEIRRRLVLDPRWYDYGTRTAALRTGGKRRFFAPAAISPRW